MVTATPASTAAKVVTLPAPGGNANNGTNGNGNTGINGGRITTLPVNNGGKTGGLDTKVDVKTSMPAQPRHHPADHAPAAEQRPRDEAQQQSVAGQVLNNSQPGKESLVGNGGGNNNGGSRMAMGGGQMRRGF